MKYFLTLLLVLLCHSVHATPRKSAVAQAVDSTRVRPGNIHTLPMWVGEDTVWFWQPPPVCPDSEINLTRGEIRRMIDSALTAQKILRIDTTMKVDTVWKESSGVIDIPANATVKCEVHYDTNP